MSDLKERIPDVIGKPHMAGLATVTEDGRPWVRYVMPAGRCWSSSQSVCPDMSSRHPGLHFKLL